MKNLTPLEAWTHLQQTPDTLFVDVRMEIESMYVGRPPGVVNVPWYEYPDLTPDPVAFAETVAREAREREAEGADAGGDGSRRGGGGRAGLPPPAQRVGQLQDWQREREKGVGLVFLCALCAQTRPSP